MKSENAKSLADLLCPPHASLDASGNLEPFDNCIACIRVQRDELHQHIIRIRARLVNDRAISAGDYDEAEEYADRMVRV